MSSANVSLPSAVSRGGDVPSSSPALSKAWTEERSQCCLLRPEGCAFFFFFFGSIISDSTVHFPGKAPPEHDWASWQGTARGCLETFGGKTGEKKKKKKHTPFLLALSIRQPATHSSGEHHRAHFIRQRTQESTLTRLPTQRPSRGERFWIILSNKSPPRGNLRKTGSIKYV